MTTPLYFDAYTTAIETYPDDNVELKIVDVDFPGSALNADESGTFNVKVTNNGPVTLQNVRVKIKGLNGTQVHFTGGAAGFFSEIVSSPLGRDVLEGESEKFDPLVSGTTKKGPFEFKVGGPTPLSDLVKVTLEDWDAELSNIYTSHTEARAKVSATFSAEVLAS